MVNILGTPCYNTELVYVLIKQLKLQIVVKQDVFVLMNAVYILYVLLVFLWHLDDGHQFDRNMLVISGVEYKYFLTKWIRWFSIYLYIYIYLLQFSARVRIVLKSLVFIDLCIVTSAKKGECQWFQVSAAVQIRSSLF